MGSMARGASLGADVSGFGQENVSCACRWMAACKRRRALPVAKRGGRGRSVDTHARAPHVCSARVAQAAGTARVEIILRAVQPLVERVLGELRRAGVADVVPPPGGG